MKRICLNLGSGLTHFKNSEKTNWINIDVEPLKKPDLILDCTKGLPYEIDSIEEIYAGHFFEHLTYPDMIKIIEECKRVLKSGCSLIITIPDMIKTISLYNENKVSRDMMNLVAFGKEPNPMNNHKQILDEAYMINILNNYFDTVQVIQFTHHQSTLININTHIKCIK